MAIGVSEEYSNYICRREHNFIIAIGEQEKRIIILFGQVYMYHITGNFGEGLIWPLMNC